MKALCQAAAEQWRRIGQSRAYDLAMRLPIIGYSLGFLLYDLHGLRQWLTRTTVVEHQLTPIVVATVAVQMVQEIFVVLLVANHLLRRRPVARAAGLLPRAVALAAVAVPGLFFLLPRAVPHLGYTLLSLAVVGIGNAMAAVTVSFLGRSLSIMAEARRLVTSGPYAFVRHPLYACEIWTQAGFLLVYRSPAATALWAAFVLLLFLRSRYEEDVLAGAFPEYVDYRQRVPALLPRRPAAFLALFVTEPRAWPRLVGVTAAAALASGLALTLLPGPGWYAVVRLAAGDGVVLTSANGPTASEAQCRPVLADVAARLQRACPGCARDGACHAQAPARPPGSRLAAGDGAMVVVEAPASAAATVCAAVAASLAAGGIGHARCLPDGSP